MSDNPLSVSARSGPVIGILLFFPLCATTISRKQAGLRNSTWRGTPPRPSAVSSPPGKSAMQFNRNDIRKFH